MSSGISLIKIEFNVQAINSVDNLCRQSINTVNRIPCLVPVDDQIRTMLIILIKRLYRTIEPMKQEFEII